jgi:hypothetical protein
LRADLRAHREYCERMLTLGNVASRRKLLSQRRFHALKDARLLHTERDNPANGFEPPFGRIPAMARAVVAGKLTTSLLFCRH